MSFGFSLKKLKLGSKLRLSEIKLNFFSQIFSPANLFDPSQPVSTVKENAQRAPGPSRKCVFDEIEGSIVERGLTRHFALLQEEVPFSVERVQNGPAEARLFAGREVLSPAHAPRKLQENPADRGVAAFHARNLPGKVHIFRV